MGIWIVAAVAGPTLYYANGNWFSLLPFAVALCMLTGIAICYGRHWDGPVYHFIQFLWIAILLSQFLGYSAKCWPTGEQTFPIVPLALLILSAISALKGNKNTANGISVVFWLSLLLLGIVFVSGSKNMKFEYIQPNTGEISVPMILVLFLPAAGGFIKCERCSILPFIVIAILAISISLWISGSLSSEIAEVMPWPFYEAAKSVELFDVAKRLESLVSVGITLYNYCLYSLLLCASASIGEKYSKRREAIIISVGVSACFMLLGFIIDLIILSIITMCLWVILPLIGLLKKKEKEL
jgi:hypothetical protein